MTHNEDRTDAPPGAPQEEPREKSQETPRACPAVREKLVDFLPTALERALDIYRSFMKMKEHETDNLEYQDAQKVKDTFEACRAIVAHIEALTKLAKWADLPDAGAPQEGEAAPDLASLMVRAQAEVNTFYDKAAKKKGHRKNKQSRNHNRKGGR